MKCANTFVRVVYKSLDCLRPRSDHFLSWDRIRPLWQYYSALLPEEHICMADIAYLKVVGQQIQGNWKTANDVLLYLSKFGSDLFVLYAHSTKLERRSLFLLLLAKEHSRVFDWLNLT